MARIVRKKIDSLVIFFKENLLAVLAVLFFLIVQLIFVNSHFVNYEYVFAEGSKRISQAGLFSADLSFYARGMANPLFTSIFGAPFIYLLGFSEWSVHLPFIILSTAFLFGFYLIIKKIFSKTTALISSLLMMFNPLFWNYSGMMYSDVLCLILVSCSIFFLYSRIESDKKSLLLVSSVFMCLAFLTKYLAAIYFVFVFIFLARLHYENARKLKSGSISHRMIFFGKSVLSEYWPFLAFFILLCLSYVFWTLNKFGFLLSPAHHKAIFWSWSVFLINYLSSFSGYIIWLALFAGLIGFFSVYSLKIFFNRLFHRGLLVVSLLVVDSVILLFFYRPVGELDFGFLDAFMPKPFSFILKLAALFIGEMIIIDIIRIRAGPGSIKYDILRWWILFSLVALSVARPTQRYLLLVLPPFAVYCGICVEDKKVRNIFRRTAVIFTLLVFFILCIFLTVYRFNLGMASAEIVNYINTNDLVAGLDAEPGIHSYYLFDDKSEYPIDNYLLAYHNRSREYYAGVLSSVNRSEYKSVFVVPVSVFNIPIKELAVTKKIY